MNYLRLLVFAPGVALFVVCVAARPASAQVDYEARQRSRQLPIARATAAITLDGALDEATWQTAAVATDCLQNEPHHGEPASEQTDVRVTYDGAFLYIGVVAHDSAPHEITSAT